MYSILCELTDIFLLTATKFGSLYGDRHTRDSWEQEASVLQNPLNPLKHISKEFSPTFEGRNLKHLDFFHQVNKYKNSAIRTE